MSIQHLENLFDQLPELFQQRSLPSDWDENLIILPINDPEMVTVGEVRRSDNLGEPEEADILELEATGLIAPDMSVPIMDPAIIEVLGGTHSGAPIAYNPSFTPPPDCLAFYLPFHYFLFTFS